MFSKRTKSNRIDSTRHVVLQQLMKKVKSARNVIVPKSPKDGWIRTIRQALGMSGAQFAKKMGYTRNKISILERKEASGDITINQLKELAEGLDAELVYCVVSRKDPEQFIDDQARKKATEIIQKTHQNMCLESQHISNEAQEEQIRFLANEIKREGGKSLWG
ncbi:mobile mystery protein A [Desulforhopalus sp. IMCC35007]|uniref:mobile mystery protein A n=1 Tax=Desulforhopalus sp. IMCC35007 TaxID=2569543 RepID=UPI0010AE7E75|nr:mobile mystery protein A [Desulforhopalus sp. IMCC35007]TKB05908.1 mobile mystery protein A [Desulforhopalus sp. IMCC35007]